MDYAIILCFDSDTDNYFQNIINSIADSGVSSYMTDKKIPPHITLAFFCTEKIDRVIDELDKRISDFKTGDITWASLGAFVPHALYSAPVLNEYLLNACINANHMVEPFSTVGDNGHYLPYQWVPHTSLAVQLDNERLKKAFYIASQQFTAINGKSNRLLLAECNPYTKIKSWDLK